MNRIMNDRYKKTIYACFTGYTVQAIVNNFAPLLFVTFHNTYGIPLSEITVLVTVNFTIQVFVDFASIAFVDKIGYRASLVIAHALAACGLVFLAVLPDITANPYTGIMIAVVFYAVGGGLLEVLVSPVVESCPTTNKEAAMSLLHSFYCWGHVGVVLISTIFFTLFGIRNWKVLALIWAIIPLANLFCFTRVPIAPLIKDDEKGMTVRELFSLKIFWIVVLMMFCSGACEQAVSQWASTFAEEGLNVSKSVGDLAGPMFFAAAMGISRVLYVKLGDKMPIKKALLLSGLLCLFSYLLISLSPIPVLSLTGCGICGFSVGILWPGVFSISSASVPKGGTALFAMLALGGDIGCSGGPTYVGLVSGAAGDNLHTGILFAVIFPIFLLTGLSVLNKIKTGNKIGGVSGA